MLSILPTGFGKSLVSQLLSDFLPVKSSQNIVIVVCPLTSIIEDQISALKLIGIPADILPIIKEDSSLYNADGLFERKEDSESKQTSVRNILWGTSVLMYFFNKSYAFSAYSDRETVQSLHNNSTRFGCYFNEKLLYCCCRKNADHVPAFSVAST